MIKTPFTELLGIEHPIVQGGMQWVGRAELVAAVSEAGALGILTGLTQPTPEDLSKEIARTQEMTAKPFGVNLTILPTINPVPYDEYAGAIIDAGVKIVETAGRNPQDFLPAFKAAGIKVVHKCTSVRHALKAQQIGCDAVSIDGFECAGHPGEDDVPGLVLIPATARVLDIPFIASGGIANAQGLVAAMALGAHGVNMGTRFMCTAEAPVHENVKKQIVAASELDTSLIFRTMHNTARIFKNSIADEVVTIERANPGDFSAVQKLVSGQEGRKVLSDGDMDKGIWSAGQVVGLINDIPTCQDLVQRMVAEAEELIQKRLTSCVA